MTLNERYADDDKDVGSMREGMSKNFASRFGDLEHVEVAQIATFLDPRYKEQYFSSERLKKMTKNLATIKCNNK